MVAEAGHRIKLHAFVNRVVCCACLSITAAMGAMPRSQSAIAMIVHMLYNPLYLRICQ